MRLAGRRGSEALDATSDADTALRLARYFGITPEFRVDVQARSDLDVAKKPAQAHIDEEVPPRAHERPMGREDLRPLLDQEAEGS